MTLHLDLVQVTSGHSSWNVEPDVADDKLERVDLRRNNCEKIFELNKLKRFTRGGVKSFLLEVLAGAAPQVSG